ncbi:transmembrane ascorbate-dependent reductase CYB561-like isoform X2 [Diadema antillarum]|uniref:transmembrane ascorbate-dependent reductase CYB561-like isoform X2 n=1 Tax=Diadema antillarum TaxID=105358 RepID=UPI003A8884E0
MFVFYLLLGASQVLAILILILAGYWTGHTLGGFAWDGSSQEFNLHPLLMTLGLIFLYGDAILMFRILRRENKTAVKVIHLLMQALALVCACIALKAVFAFHNKNSIPNLYSLHSWVGLTAFILFACQWHQWWYSLLHPAFRRVCWQLPGLLYPCIWAYCGLPCDQSQLPARGSSMRGDGTTVFRRDAGFPGNGSCSRSPRGQWQLKAAEKKKK